MAISEGEMLELAQACPRMGWDSRSAGTRQRWLVDGFRKRLITSDAEEQWIRNNILGDQPPYPAPLPGAPGTTEQGKAWSWTLLQGLPTA